MVRNISGWYDTRDYAGGYDNKLFYPKVYTKGDASQLNETPRHSLHMDISRILPVDNENTPTNISISCMIRIA